MNPNSKSDMLKHGIVVSDAALVVLNQSELIKRKSKKMAQLLREAIRIQEERKADE